MKYFFSYTLYFFISIIIISLTSCGSTHKAEVTSTTNKTPAAYIENVNIDGKNNEWNTVPLDFSPKSTFQFAIANNNSNLFIYLRVPDQGEQMKLLHGGMEIYVNGAGKKSKSTGVIYPVKGELGELEKPSVVDGEKPDMKQLRLRIAGQLISFGRTGFKPDFNGVQSIRQNTGFKAAIGWDENDDMIYELTIPFNALPDDIDKKDLSLGFYVNGMDRPKNDGNTTTTFGSGGESNRMGGGRSHTNFGNGPGKGQRHAETSAYNQREKLYMSENFWTDYSCKF